MVTDTIQIISERPDLSARVVHVFCARWLTRWNITREVKPLKRKIDRRFRLVPEPATAHGNETLQLDEEYWREPNKRKGLGRSAVDLAARAVPILLVAVPMTTMHLPFLVAVEDLGTDPAVKQLRQVYMGLARRQVQRQPLEGVIHSRGLLSAATLHHVAHLVACQALHSVHVLSLEQVDDKAVVPHLVDLPFLVRSNLRREGLQRGLALGRHLNRLGPHLDTIQVLVQAVHDKRQELLRVVLLRARKVRLELDDGFLSVS